MPDWQPPMPPAAPDAHAADRARGSGRRLPARVHQPDLRPPPATGTGRASLPAALVAVSLRAGRPLWIPAEVAGTCCATPGPRRATSTAPPGWPTRRSRSSGAGATAGSCRSSSTRPPARTGCSAPRGTLSPINAEHLASMQVLDSIEWATRRAAARARDRRQGRERRRSIRRARAATSGLDTRARAPRRRARRGGRRPGRGRLLRLRRRSRLPAPGADRVGDGGARPTRSAGSTPTRTSAPTGPARSGWSGRPASATSRSSTCSSG